MSEAVRKDFKALPVVSLLAVLGDFHLKSFKVKCKCGVMFVDYFACLVPLFVHIYYSETPRFNLQTNKSSIQEADSCRTTGAALYIWVVVYAMDWKVVDRLVCQICRTNAAVVLSAPTNRAGSFVHCSPRIAYPSVHSCSNSTVNTGFPLGLENMQKWEGILQSGKKSGNFEETGKVREKSGEITQNTGKLREFRTNVISYF